MSQYSFVGKKLMTPGPVPLSPKVRAVLTDLECHHRSPEFQEVLVRVLKNLKSIFLTNQHCYLLAATGTGGLEAAMVNCLQSSKPSLFINGGKFGQRWGKIAKAYGIPFDEISLEWGRDVDLNQVEEMLKKTSYQALAWQACETSTGALLPSRALGELAKKYGVLSLVDGITALGATELPMDQWGLDVMVGGSQKAFMLPTGMSFIALSERAQQVDSDISSYYFDLKSEYTANQGGKTRYSTPTQFVLALDLILKDILDIGFQAHLDEIKKRAEIFRQATSLKLFPDTSSPSLSCLRVPQGIKATAIKNKVYEQGFIIVAGQDQLKEQVLRVGHMGAMTMEDLKKTAQTIEMFL